MKSKLILLEAVCSVFLFSFFLLFPFFLLHKSQEKLNQSMALDDAIRMSYSIHTIMESDSHEILETEPYCGKKEGDTYWFTFDFGMGECEVKAWEDAGGIHVITYQDGKELYRFGGKQ